MKYSNEKVRRQDRLLTELESRELLEKGEYGFLSMVDENERPYGIPINYVWDGVEAIYLHCAPVGEKLRCIQAHPEVAFCVVGRTHVVSDKFTTGYESVILRGVAHTGLSPEERMQALRLLLSKYSPDDMTVGLKYAEKSFHRTEIVRIDLQEFSGKCKRVR
ncbi:MAG: pyridoxamine 5'-phosphate oxidase family protein [Bacteroides sp.]|nr:pyridoxamine 5'-phosphate oxidase family protein [Bacteroides sp.]